MMTSSAGTVRARLLLLAVVCVLWLVPSTASAQCWYEAGLYADLYDNGVDAIEVYGAGWDGSYCPPCGHGYQLDANLWFNSALVDSQSYSWPEGTANYYTVYPGWVSYDVTFTIYCSCGGAIPVGQVGGSQQVQRAPMPTDEYSSFLQSWHSDGRGSWAGILLLTNVNFYGRYVEEYIVLFSGNDSCHANDPDQIYDPVGLTGGLWNVQASNVYGPDHIGYYSHVITHYRNIGAASGPDGCALQFGQDMRINHPDVPPLMVSYKVQTIGGRITDTTVTSIRNGAEGSRVWP